MLPGEFDHSYLSFSCNLHLVGCFFYDIYCFILVAEYDSRSPSEKYVSRLILRKRYSDCWKVYLIFHLYFSKDSPRDVALFEFCLLHLLEHLQWAHWLFKCSSCCWPHYQYIIDYISHWDLTHLPWLLEGSIVLVEPDSYLKPLLNTEPLYFLKGFHFGLLNIFFLIELYQLGKC